MEVILSTFYAGLFYVIIRKFRFYRISGTGKYTPEILLTLKIISGVALGLLYTYYYTDRHTADTFRLFDDSKIIFDLWSTRPADFLSIMSGIGADDIRYEALFNKMHNWYDIYSPVNDNRFMIRMNVILRFLSFGNYYVHVIFVAFLSFTGTIALIRFSRKYVDNADRLTVVIFGFIPSVLFWGSGLMKDAVVIFSMGMTLYFFGKCLQKKPAAADVLFLLISAVLLTLSRFQIMTILAPGLLAWYIHSRFSSSPLATFSIVTLGFAFFSLMLSPINLPDLLLAKQQSFVKLSAEQMAGSYIGYIPFEANLLSIMSHTPVAFLTTLTRPFITDISSPLIALNTIENILILFLALYTARHMDLGSALANPMFAFSGQFVLILFSLIGLVTPILGAIVRYKTPALPFLLLIFIIALKAESRRNLENKLSKTGL